MFTAAIDRNPVATTLLTLAATIAASLVCLGAAIGPAIA